ncbi:MAG TPA: ABC transporter substrate-binding protein [Usitatibacter sp.]|nr:ABC transporter substrate-binding protein [Usitatibacter sp.]
MTDRTEVQRGEAAAGEGDESFEAGRRRFIQTSLLGLSAGMAGLPLGSAWAADDTSGGAPRKGGTLVMVVQPEPPTLASYNNTSGPIGQVAPKVYDGLLEYDMDLNPIAGLAKSWIVSPDGKTVTFKLEEGVRFHDGKPFTSADVQYSIMEVLKKVHPRGPTNFQEVEAVDTPDAHTAIFRLKNAAPYMMKALSAYESPMVPKHLFEGTDLHNNAYANKPIGTGPFKFVEWQRGQYMRFDRNPDYWRKGKPYFDRVVARFIGEAQTRTAAVERGEVAFAAYNAVPNVDAKRLSTSSTLMVTTRGYEMDAPIVELEFNTKRKPFDNQKVRQAIAYAIDRRFVIDNIWFGYGKPATGPISSNFRGTGLYTDEVLRYDVPNRMQLANRLLDEAGYPRKGDGTRFEMMHDITPYGEEWRRFGEYVQQVLQQLGIKATLRYEDVPTWIRRIYTNYDYDMTSDWLKTFGDPVIGVQRQYWSKAIRPGTPWVNGTRWTSPKVDELLEAAAVEPDPKRRNELYHEFQKIVVEASQIVWVMELDFTTVYNRKLQNAVISPLGVNTSFDGAWMKA